MGIHSLEIIFIGLQELDIWHIEYMVNIFAYTEFIIKMYIFEVICIQKKESKCTDNISS